MTGGRRVTAGVLAGAVVAGVIPTVLPIFGGGAAAWLAAAVAVPALIAVASFAAAGRAPVTGRPAVRLAAEVAGVLVLLALAPAGAGGASPLGGLRDGAAQLVTSVLPAPANGPELGVAVVAVALAAAAAVEWAGRSGPSAGPLAPPALLYGAALVVGAGGAAAPRWGALVVVALGGVLLLARPPATGADPPGSAAGRSRGGPNVAAGGSPGGPPAAAGGPRVAGGDAAGGLRLAAERPAGRFPAAGRLLTGGAVLAAVVALAVPAGTALPGAGDRQPYDLRAALSPAPQPLDEVSLLSTYASVYDGPARPVFTVSARGANPVSLYWRLDIFDQFQGDEWTSSAVFQRAGTELPAGPALQVATTAVSADVTLLQPSSYLPTPERPVSVSIAGLDVSTPDGLLAVPGGMAPPGQYQVRAEVPTPDRSQLLAAEGTTAPDDPASPALPAGITSIAARLIAHAGPDALSRLAAISSYLTGPGFALHLPGDSPIGSGDYQVLQLLTSSHVGSSEQYAGAFALLARAMGFNTRLVVGYLGGQPNASGTEVTYTTRDLTVWPEVQLDGIGWLPFPADPSSGARPQAPSASPTSPLGQALRQQQRINAAGPLRPPVQGPPVVPPVQTRAAGAPVAAIVAAVLGVSLAVLLAVLGAKSLRRRRQRRRGSPAGRVSGAWDHVLDRLAELGVGVPASLTGDDVVGRAGARFGAACAHPIAALAALVDVTRYDRRYPPMSETADAAWAHAGELDAALRLSVPFRRRLRAGLSLAAWRR